MAKKRKKSRTTKRHRNPVVNPSKKRTVYRRRNPSVKGILSKVQEPVGLAFGIALPEKIMDLIGIPRFVKKYDSKGGTKTLVGYKRNWLRGVISGVGGYLLADTSKNSILANFGKGAMAKGVADLLNGSMLESSEYTNKVASALENSGSDDLKALVKDSAIGFLNGLEGGGTVGQLIFDPNSGEVYDDELPSVNYLTAGLSGNQPYFEIK